MAKNIINTCVAAEAATNHENPGTDEIIGTVNDKHSRTMADLEARTEKARQERARLQRVRNCTAVLKAVASMGICGLLFYAWLCSLVAPVVVAPLLILFAFIAGVNVGGHPRVFMPWRFRR